ncbi:hypothetical protein [Actinacidiphila sp. bgisy145]|uniref:hypothetical protein n=1 Tax=Actinacidiphila sp. bgisy145 TaxID=3413792 RepID=UPI003EBA3E19
MTITAFPMNAASGAPSYASQIFRDSVAALLSPGASGLQVQQGVRPGPGLDVSVSGTTVTISPGVAVIQGGSSTAQGPYMLVSDAAVTKTLTAADGTNPRIDLIYARIQDTDADGSGARAGDILYYAGTPAASPVAPTPTQPSWIPLATITVPKSGGGSAVVSTATRAYTAAAGGLTVGAVAPPSPYTGQLWDSGTGTQRWDGTQWRYLAYTPVANTQQASPPFNTTGAFTDFLAASWAPITVTVPPSGMVRVTISADITNTNTSTSTCHATWRASGALTVAAGPYNSLTVYGSRLAGSRTRLLQGATVGAALTITPQWNISSGSSSTAALTGGTLEVTPIA